MEVEFSFSFYKYMRMKYQYTFLKFASFGSFPEHISCATGLRFEYVGGTACAPLLALTFWQWNGLEWSYLSQKKAIILRFWGPKILAASCTHLGAAQVMECGSFYYWCINLLTWGLLGYLIKLIYLMVWILLARRWLTPWKGWQLYVYDYYSVKPGWCM